MRHFFYLRHVNPWYSWNKRDLKTLWPHFMGFNCLKATEPLQGDFSQQAPRICFFSWSTSKRWKADSISEPRSDLEIYILFLAIKIISYETLFFFLPKVWVKKANFGIKSSIGDLIFNNVLWCSKVIDKHYWKAVLYNRLFVL